MYKSSSSSFPSFAAVVAVEASIACDDDDDDAKETEEIERIIATDVSQRARETTDRAFLLFSFEDTSRSRFQNPLSSSLSQKRKEKNTNDRKQNK
tara:strand:+ start:1209 stop:1493 length:285 start_codon:yes stop_codon:yes gene_type:complete